MFDRDEIQALVLGARIVRQFGDPALAREAVIARRKLELARYGPEAVRLIDS
jgi:hypothetical protein